MARPLLIRQLSEEIQTGVKPGSSAAVRSLVKLPEMKLPVASANGAQLADIAPEASPYLVSLPAIRRSARKAPLVVQANRLLQIALVASCAIALCGYGFDVAVSNDVVRLQEQARRLSEQNAELSAKLLKTISFQGIQESTLGSVGLRVPEQVLIVKEVPPVKVPPFKASRNYLPLMSGY
jgi:hypothetical protein